MCSSTTVAAGGYVLSKLFLILLLLLKQENCLYFPCLRTTTVYYAETRDYRKERAGNVLGNGRQNRIYESTRLAVRLSTICILDFNEHIRYFQRF